MFNKTLTRLKKWYNSPTKKKLRTQVDTIEGARKDARLELEKAIRELSAARRGKRNGSNAV